VNECKSPTTGKIQAGATSTARVKATAAAAAMTGTTEYGAALLAPR
jgi:hypothetical protein